MEIVMAGFKVVEEQEFLKTSYFIRFTKSDRETVTGHTIDSLNVVKELLSTKTAVLVDVREQAEWNKGHVRSAQLLPLSKLRKETRSKNFAKQIAKSLPTDKIIYTHCRSGGRSLLAAEILEGLGYDVRPLKAGYINLIEAGFPNGM